MILLGLAGKSLLDRPDTSVQKVAVPTVVDLPEATASAAIRKAGLVPQTSQVASTKDIGTVVEQSPGAGENDTTGSTVSLSISSGPDTVTLPDLRGYSEAEAKAALDNLNLKIASTKDEDNTDVDKGKVTKTEPASGQTVAVGSSVTLYLSSGLAEVPSVTGKTRNEAADELGSAGFETKTVYADSTQPEGTVIKQSVKAGTKAEYGSEVTITVAKPQVPTPTTTTTTTTTPPPTATSLPTIPVTPTTGTTP